MTKNKKAKRATRSLQAETGLSYTAARRRVTGGSPVSADKRREELLAPYLQGACDRLISEPINAIGEIQLPGSPSIDQPAVDQIAVDLSSIWVEVVEEYEGGTEVCNVFARAELTVEGLMPKGEATMAAASELVAITDPDFNRHYATVVVEEPVEIQVEFAATITPDVESVEDFTFTGGANA